MSLELALEKTYHDLAAANESALRNAKFYFAHETTQMEQGEIDKQDLPSISLTANRQQEAMPNCGVYFLELVIAVEDAAVRESGISETLNTLFVAAVRPLLYARLPAMMTGTGAADGMKCFGLTERGEAATPAFGEGTCIITQSAIFICSEPPV